MKIPEAAAVYLPKPSVAKLKIPPHITEVQSPQRVKSITVTGTSARLKDIFLLNTGMFTNKSVGRNIAMSTKSNPKEATKESIALLENLAPKVPPINRPMNIKNQ